MGFFFSPFFTVYLNYFFKQSVYGEHVGVPVPCSRALKCAVTAQSEDLGVEGEEKMNEPEKNKGKRIMEEKL